MSAVIIGATSGIAHACAQTFAQNGHRLLLSGRDPETLSAAAAQLESGGADLETLILDVERLGHFDLAVEHIDKFLDDDPYILIAVGSIVASDLARHDADAALRLVDINFRNLVALLTPLADVLEKRGRGCLIIVGSVAGDRGRQSNYIYGAAKAGLATFAQGLRNRLFSSGVHVMTVKPGYVDTAMLRASLGDGADRVPGFLVGDPERVAQRIVRAAERRRDIIYVMPIWRAVMWVIRAIPERIFKRLSL